MPSLPTRRPARTIAATAASLACALGLGLGLPPLPAQAELPPWVYGEQQRQAPLVADLLILEVAPLPAAGEGIRVRGRVLAVRRQAPGGTVRPRQVLTLRLPAPPPRHQLPMVGPAPLRPPTQGSRLTAWLQPAPDRTGLWLPAAGGRSFGPSLETSLDPNPASPQR